MILSLNMLRGIAKCTSNTFDLAFAVLSKYFDHLGLCCASCFVLCALCIVELAHFALISYVILHRCDAQ